MWQHLASKYLFVRKIYHIFSINARFYHQVALLSIDILQYAECRAVSKVDLYCFRLTQTSKFFTGTTGNKVRIYFHKVTLNSISYHKISRSYLMFGTWYQIITQLVSHTLLPQYHALTLFPKYYNWENNFKFFL